MLIKKNIKFIVLIVLSLVLVSCTAGPNELSKTAAENGNITGFFSGFWHGFILLFSFIVSLFNDHVSVYEIHNSGPLYNLGFLLGVSTFFSGSGSASSRKKRK